MTHEGSYSKLHEAYDFIFEKYLPSKKEEYNGGIVLEEYLNNPHEIPEEKILTLIYIPLK